MKVFEGNNFEANVNTPIDQTEIKPVGSSTLFFFFNFYFLLEGG